MPDARDQDSNAAERTKPPAQSIPEPGPEAEPAFDEPVRPAPTVADPPARSAEF